MILSLRLRRRIVRFVFFFLINTLRAADGFGFFLAIMTRSKTKVGEWMIILMVFFSFSFLSCVCSAAAVH